MLTARSNKFENISPVATIFVSVSKILDKSGQNNLAETSNCVFLSRKGDFSELHSPPISMLFLKCLSVNAPQLQH